MILGGGFKFEGMNEWELNLKLFNERFRADLKRVVDQASYKVVKRAVENLHGQHGHRRHWITGTLGRSIQGKADWVSHTEIEGVIGTDVPYAPYVEAMEDGFLLQALLAKSVEIYEDIRTKMQKIIDKPY